MIKISKKNNAIIVEGVDDNLYPFSGELSYPQNSVIVVTDESDIVTFRSAANNDVLFSGLIGQLTIEGENVTKENVGEKFDKIANGTSGGTLVDARLFNMHNYGDEKIQLDKVHADGSAYSDYVHFKTINGETLLEEGNIVVGGDVYQVSCEFDWGNNLSVGVYKNGVITDEVTCQLEVLLADNSAEYPTPTMSGKHYVFPIIDTYLIGTLRVNLTNPYKDIATIVVPMYPSLQRIDTALANKQDVIDDLDQMRMNISTAFSEASSAASAASDASGMASEALYGLANKQDVINETVDMEVTYDDGTTETITLYKAN